MTRISMTTTPQSFHQVEPGVWQLDATIDVQAGSVLKIVGEVRDHTRFVEQAYGSSSAALSESPAYLDSFGGARVHAIVTAT